MPNPTAAMLVIGDEILSGRTRDANMFHLAGELTAHGIDLREVRIVSDNGPAIVAAVKTLSSAFEHVFTSGGIGPTHDDITADCIAEAFGAPIDVRDDARALLAEHYERQGSELNEARLRMARIPDGASLIDNPVSIAPGFRIANVHVMAGVPSVFRAMLASVMPTLTGGAPLLSQTLRIDRGEGDIAGPLAKLAADFPDLSIGSYPFQKNGAYGSNIVVRGHDGAQIDAAIVRLSKEMGLSELPSIEELYEVCVQTWPAASETRIGPWIVRDGQGGGQRVSATTAEQSVVQSDLIEAEHAMQQLGQPSLFTVRDGETDFDALLAANGYAIKDPVNIYACPITHLTDVEIPRVTAFTIWEPLQIMRDIWAAGGIDDARLNVMRRSTCPKTALLGRWNDQPAGTGYVAIYDKIAMVHALEILEHQRGLGVGKWMMRRAAVWAAEQGARQMSVICTKENDAANALYTSLGMTLFGSYHYRIKID